MGIAGIPKCVDLIRDVAIYRSLGVNGGETMFTLFIFYDKTSLVI